MLRKMLAAVLSVAMAVAMCSVAPAAAHADDTADLMARVKALRSSIDGAKAEHLSAIQQTEQLQSQSAALQSELDGINAKLAEKQKRLSDILVQEYKTPTISSMIESLMSAGTIDNAIKQLEYANKITEDRARTVAEIDDLQEKASTSMEEIEVRKSEASVMASEAEAAESAWQAQLSTMRPQLKKLRSEYLAKATGTAGSEQLSAALDYLETVDGTTEQQEALLRAAYRTPYSGSNYCERWVGNVYRNAGYPYANFASAAADAKANWRSSDLGAIPVGALVFGSGSGSYMGARYGHVGICVASGTGNGDALILDNEGSRTKKAVPLSEWSEWQVSVSWVSGKRGAFGWGFPSSVTGIDGVVQ